MPVVQAGDDVIEFPDSMSPEDIQSALGRRYQSKALDYALSAPQNAVSGLTKTLQSGAEGADMGRRQDLANQMQMARIEGASGRGQEQLLGGLEKAAGFVHEMYPLNLLKRTIALPQQITGGPQYEVSPALSPETVRKGIDFLDPTTDEAGSLKEGVKQFLAETVSSFTSPDQAALLATGGLASKLKVKDVPEIIGRQFQVQVSAQIPQATQSLVEALKSGDATEVGKSAASLAAAVAIPTAIEKGIRGKVEKGPTPQLLEPEVPQAISEEAPPSVVAGKANRAEAGEGSAVESGVAPPETPQAMAEPSPKPPVEQQPTVTPTVTELGQGPGARTYEPRNEPPESYEETALKNAVADVERASYGLPEATPTEKRAIAVSWIKAADRLEENPTLGSKLVDELNKNPDRGLDDVESMVLLRHKVGIENAINNAAERTNTSTDPAERAAAQSDFSSATAQLQDFLDAVRSRGTSAGREFRLRQVLAKEDYSLATMTKRFRAERGGRGITDAEQKTIADLSKKLQDTEKRAVEAEAKAKTEASERAAESEINRIALEAAKEGPRIHPKILDIAESIVKKMESRAVDATARLREKMSRMSAGVDPTIILDLAEIGSAKIARGIVDFGKWSEAMLEHVKDDRIKPFLQQAWEKSQELFNSDTVKTAGKNTEKVKQFIKKTADLNEQKDIITDRIKSKMETHRLDEVNPLVQQLAKIFSQQGLRGWRAINDAVHGVLKQIVPDLDYRETMDAVSGHGKFRVPSQAEADAALRDAKAQTNQIRKIQEVIARQPVQPTGFKRDLPSDIQRRLTQIYENAKRRFGVVVTDPATQLRSALQARKTYYTNRMSDLQSEINSRKRIVRNKALPPTDPELESLISRYNEVKAEHDAVFGKRELTDEQRAELEAKSLDRQIEEIQRQIKEGDIFPAGKKPAFEAKSNESRRSNLEALKSEREYLRESINPKSRLTPDEKSLNALKSRLKRDTADKLDRMARGDFSTKPKRPPPVLDSEAVKLRDENAKVRADWEKRLIQERYANRTTTGKMADMAVQWSRISKLMSVRVYGKLLNAGLLRSVFEPASRVAGLPLKFIAPDIYAKSRVESGTSVRSVAKYWSTAVTSWGKAWEKLRTGSTDIDRIRGAQRIKPDLEMLNFVGNSHGMFKEPFRQAAFERSKVLAAERMIKLGENPDDPINTTQILSAAAENADRNIFTQPNMVTKYLIKVPIGALKGSPLKSAQALGRTMEFLMPIVNVPANIAAHTMRLNPLVGWSEAALRLREVRKQGFATTEDAEAISRAFKLGNLGAVLAVYAWLHPENFGGVYEEHKPRDEEGLKHGEVNLFGVTMPAWISHSPEIMWLNTVASASRIYERYVEQHPDRENSGRVDAAWFTVLSPVKNFPVIDNYIRNFSESRSPARTAGALTRDAIIPSVITSGLKSVDTEERRPEGFFDELKMGVPGLRDTVPTR